MSRSDVDVTPGKGGQDLLESYGDWMKLCWAQPVDLRNDRTCVVRAVLWLCMHAANPAEYTAAPQVQDA